ncbi:hypothetical protein VNO80_30597 [Phaseolus coccineus]|uniref:Uncharacterized protein n=1 Tax=Phaseolus coccineus TaxID=3886 RepID=A0AAN9LI40_PHACN
MYQSIHIPCNPVALLLSCGGWSDANISLSFNDNWSRDDAVKSVEDLLAEQAEIDSPLRLGYDWVDLCETKYFSKYQRSWKVGIAVARLVLSLVLTQQIGIKTSSKNCCLQLKKKEEGVGSQFE